MSTDDGDVEEMAECGACRAVVPVNSTECSECGVSFTGVSDSNLGECGACGALVPLDSKSCTQCGVVFVADDVIQILGDWLNATGLSVVELFKRFDANNDGVIEASEFKTGLLALNIADLPESQVERLVETLDEDGDGVIDLNELESTFKPPDNEPTKQVGPEEDDASSDDGDEEDSDDAPDDEEDSEDSGEEGADDDSEEEDSDDAPDDEEDSDDASDDEEDSDDASDDEEDSDEEEEEEVPDTPLGRMIKNFKDAGYNAQMAFEHMDVNNDGQIDNEELEKALTEFGGGVISNEDVEEVMKEVDFDENGSISIEELVSAFGEKFEEESDSDEDTAESDASADSDKEFPTDLQKKLMSKKANDIFWPIMHALFGLFMVLWIANGLGVFVDGEGGIIVHSGDSFFDEDGNLVDDGDSTQCDKEKGHDCSNSLTPLYGADSSMPAGFYWDGILMTVLGAAGLIGSLYAHLVLMKNWRARAKGDSDGVDDSADEDSSEETKDDSDDEDGGSDDEEKEDSDSDKDDDSDEDDDSGEDDDSDEDDDEDSDDDDEEDSDDDDEKDSDDDDEEDSGDEGEDIDVGSRVGVEVDGEEIFGTIIEFNDDDDTVVIEDEETGDEIEAPQESMFLE